MTVHPYLSYSFFMATRADTLVSDQAGRFAFAQTYHAWSTAIWRFGFRSGSQTSFKATSWRMNPLFFTHAFQQQRHGTV